MFITLSFLAALLLNRSGLVKPCDVRIDSVTYMPNGYYFMSMGDKGGVASENFFDPKDWRRISDYCSGFDKVDLAFWWGIYAPTTSCHADMRHDGASLMLMQKVNSQCRWCYLLDWSEWDEWDKTRTVLKLLVEYIEGHGCDKVEALSYQFCSTCEDRHHFIIVFDGQITKLTCRDKTDDGREAQKKRQNHIYAFSTVYSHLPPEKPISLYTKEVNYSMENYFVYSDGSRYVCPDFHKRSPMPLKCSYVDNVISVWDVCGLTTTTELITSTTSRTTTSTTATTTFATIQVHTTTASTTTSSKGTTTSTSSSTAAPTTSTFTAETSEPSTIQTLLTKIKEKSNLTKVIVLLVVIAVVVLFALTYCGVFKCSLWTSKQRESDSAREPLLKKREKPLKVIRVYKMPDEILS